MIKGIYVAARGLDNRMKNLEIVANNLANLNTVGYKRDISFFEMMNQFNQPDVKRTIDFAQGNMTQTFNQLDFAINGKGFFVVEGKQGMELTRNGKFSISDDGFLVTEYGAKVYGKNGLINFNDSITKNENTVVVNRNGEVIIGDYALDSILVVLPDNTMNIEKSSNLNFNLSDGSFLFPDEGSFEILQGHLEESNVNPIQEMESMIKVSVNYESNNKIINYLDQTLEKANEIGRT